MFGACSRMTVSHRLLASGAGCWRIAQEPDQTVRAIAAKLAERGIRVSYFAVWHFFEHEGISFKKACTPVSRIGPTSRAGEGSGRSIREGLIRPA
jgi:hypothetical protein